MKRSGYVSQIHISPSAYLPINRLLLQAGESTGSEHKTGFIKLQGHWEVLKKKENHQIYSSTDL